MVTGNPWKLLLEEDSAVSSIQHRSRVADPVQNCSLSIRIEQSSSLQK
jgi:hypothetical protein